MSELLVQYLPQDIPASIEREAEPQRRMALYSQWEERLRTPLMRALAGYPGVSVETLSGVGAVVIRGPRPVLDALQAPGGLLERLRLTPVEEALFLEHG